MSNDKFMSLALVQAFQAASMGEVPVGAVVVRHGEVIATGRNAPIDTHDPTAHAEIVALRAAALVMGNYRLDECELYVTLEPCAMCSGAMLNARLKRVVFGAAEPKTGAAGSVVNLFLYPQLNHQTELQGGIMAKQARALMQDFFRQRRTAQREASMQSYPLRDDALRTPETAFENLPGYPWQANYINDLPALDGLRMHYLDESNDLEEGSTLALTYLCLHSSSTWSYIFRNMIPHLLQAGHRVVAPDLIGFGKSDKPKKELFHTFNRHRQILLELVERLDLQNIVLVFPIQDCLLSLTLPMAAAQRYLGLRFMDDALVSGDMSLSEGYRIWKETVTRLPQCDKSPKETNSPPRIKAKAATAFHVPFPNEGFCTALRAFPLTIFDEKTDNGRAILYEAHEFWLSYH